jgi:hypothetical protein
MINLAACCDHPLRKSHSRRLWRLAVLLTFYARPFLIAHRLINDLRIAVRDPNVHSFGDDTKAYIRKTLEALCEQLSSVEMNMSLKSATSLKEKIPDARQPSSLQYDVDQLGGRIEDEIDMVFLLQLSAHERRMYEDKEPFGSDVSTKFPSLAYEIEEAAKCLALGRSTASAFHSIRSLEAAIRATSRCLGIPDPTRAADRSWFKMLEAIKGELDRRWPTTSSKMSGDGRFFEEAYAALAAMQNPYRNATMHLDQIYTEEGARDIFNVVGGFMRKMAARLDENGDPKA